MEQFRLLKNILNCVGMPKNKQISVWQNGRVEKAIYDCRAMIAHRLSAIKNVKLILVLKDGGIIESGTHGKLLEKDSFYADLYSSQFEQSA